MFDPTPFMQSHTTGAMLVVTFASIAFIAFVYVLVAFLRGLQALIGAEWNDWKERRERAAYQALLDQQRRKYRVIRGATAHLAEPENEQR